MRPLLRVLTAICGLAVWLAAGPVAATGEFQLGQPEEITVFRFERTPADAALKPGWTHGGSPRLIVETASRRLELSLEDNARLRVALPAETRARLAGHALYRGRLAQTEGTWVRLTDTGAGYLGLVWTGSELLLIEPARPAGTQVLVPVQGYAFPATDVVRTAPGTGESQPGKNATDDPATSSLVTATPTRRIDVSFVADHEFYLRHRPNTYAFAIGLVNMVDGIYAEQLLLQIHPSEVRVFASQDDPFSATSVDAILDELADYRAADPSLQISGLTHLLSGRALGNDVIGTAFLDTACDRRHGASVTSAGGTGADALIVAHELGHNLGAYHDAEAGSPCEATPPTFLMAAELNFSSRLSACSLQHISAALARAACIGPVLPSEIALAAPYVTAYPGGPILTEVDYDTEFSVYTEIVNEGTSSVYDVRLDLPSLQGASFLGAGVKGPIESIHADRLPVVIGQFPAGDQAPVEIRLRADAPGEARYDIAIEGSYDDDPSNNQATGTIQVLPVVKLLLEGLPESLTVSRGQRSPLRLTLRNASGLNAQGVRVVLYDSMEFALSEVAATQGTCQPFGSAHECAIPTLGANDQVEVDLTLTAPADIPPQGVVRGSLYADVRTQSTHVAPGPPSHWMELTAYHSVADLRLAMADRTTLTNGVPATLEATLDNLGPDAAESVNLALTLPATLRLQDTAGLPCQPVPYPETGGTVNCQLGTIGSGGGRRLALQVLPLTANSGTLVLEAKHSGHDPSVYLATGAERRTSIVFVTQPPAQPPPPSGGGGGGGAGLPLVLLLLLFGRSSRATLLRDDGTACDG